MPRWLSLAERLTCNQLVEGSNPSRGSLHLQCVIHFYLREVKTLPSVYDFQLTL